MTLGIAGGCVMFLLSLFLGAQYVWSGIPGFAALLVLGFLASAAIGILAACMMVLAKRSAPILRIYGLAATLFGGVLFPIDLLPAWLRPLSWLVPQSYVINGTRGLLMQNPPPETVPFSTAALGLLVFTAVLLPIGLTLLYRSMQYARRMGMLSGY